MHQGREASISLSAPWSRLRFEERSANSLWIELVRNTCAHCEACVLRPSRLASPVHNVPVYLHTDTPGKHGPVPSGMGSHGGRRAYFKDALQDAETHTPVALVVQTWCRLLHSWGTQFGCAVHVVVELFLGRDSAHWTSRPACSPLTPHGVEERDGIGRPLLFTRQVVSSVSSLSVVMLAKLSGLT